MPALLSLAMHDILRGGETLFLAFAPCTPPLFFLLVYLSEDILDPWLTYMRYVSIVDGSDSKPVNTDKMDVDNEVLPQTTAETTEEAAGKEPKDKKKRKRKSEVKSAAIEEPAKDTTDDPKVADAQPDSENKKKGKSKSDGGEKKSRKKKVSFTIYAGFREVLSDAGAII